MFALVTPGAARAQDTHDWTGFYIGGSVGAQLSDQVANINAPDSTGFDVNFANGVAILPGTPALGGFAPFPTDFNLDDFSGAGGGQIGYNIQIERFLIGIEGDAFYLGKTHDSNFSSQELYVAPPLGTGSTFRTTDVTVSGGLTSLLTLRPRVGVAATNRLLLFATGGLAMGQAKINTSANISELYLDSGKSATADWAGSNSDTKFGFAVGGGGEFALSDRASVKLDALYYDLGSISATATGTGSTSGGATLTVAPYQAQVDLNGVVSRLGFNFRF